MSLPRKTHSKSRRGCDQCKRRHVKCDEKRPLCGSCDRLDLRCVFASSIRLHNRTEESPSYVAGPALDAEAGWPLMDLQLLHHYSTCSCLRFAPNTTRHRCWTVEVPKLSFSHRFLLHQVLAVASLHRHVEEGGAMDLAAIASSHHSKALELVRPALSSCDADTCVAVFAFAGLTAIYAYGELAVLLKDQQIQLDSIGQLLACFKLTRGISTVIDAHRQHMDATWAGEMINLSSDAERAMLDATGMRFDQTGVLEEIIQSSTVSPERARVYSYAAKSCMESIQMLLMRQDHTDDIYYLIMAWPNELSDEYVQCVERRDPMALIILAHYAVLMSMRPKLWWLARWPGLLLKQIEAEIGRDWQKYLEWPHTMMAVVAPQ